MRPVTTPPAAAQLPSTGLKRLQKPAPMATLTPLGILALTAVVLAIWAGPAAGAPQRSAFALLPLDEARLVGAERCAVSVVGDSIPSGAIGEPVSAVTLAPPRWVDATDTSPARCEVDGVMAPVDRSATARPINFTVWLPGDWNGRAVQLGGGGMNGTVPNPGGGDRLDGRSAADWGFVTFGSDSGHQSGFGGGRGRGGPRAGGPPAGARSAGPGSTPAGVPATARGQAPRAGGAPAVPAGTGNDWALNEEAMRNLGYAQLKKTHDAAFVLIDRFYGTAPRYTYFVGTSQGGREGLTVVQRYPDDYDGVLANVPIVNFSSLMLGPELIRIQEKPLENWVTPAKTNAIAAEFMRQCDGLDNRVDGIINNYMACRAVFDVSQGAPDRHPWASKRCPGGVDPNPEDTSAAACLTDGQIETLEFVYQPYRFATPLAHGVESFGMWAPTTDPDGSGLIVGTRFRGQEGAAPDAPMHSQLGILGVTGFLMQDLQANPLDYEEGGALDDRREAISPVLDATDPDLSPFADSGGRLIVTVGTDDTLASSGAQLDYYQSVIDTMGQGAVDDFARFFVIPQAGHGLSGSVYPTDGNGQPTSGGSLPNGRASFAYLINWVERGIPPARSLEVTSADRALPLCSYPMYPRYVNGPEFVASSYTCAQP